MELLERTKESIEASEELSWEGLSSAEMVMDLSIAIEKLEGGDSIDRNHLRMLFSPTGPLQEMAITSGWSDEYVELLGCFDGLIYSVG